MAKKKVSKTIPKEALDRMFIAREQGRGWLDFGGVALRELPEEILTLPNLKHIDLSTNALRALPEWLRGMGELESLNLLDNPIESLPDFCSVTIDGATFLRCREQVRPNNTWLVLDPSEFHSAGVDWLDMLLRCEGLRGLTIGSWSLTLGHDHSGPSPRMRALLDGIGELGSIESLSLRGIRLSAVPEGIRRLRRLASLSLDGIALKRVPAWIGGLDLRRLSLCDNGLRDLPVDLAGLSRLETLDISWNPMKRIPPVVFDLGTLIQLDVTRCDLHEIPADILRMEKLQHLSVGWGIDRSESEIESPPAEVVQQGLDAIRDYWRQRADSGVDYLCEAKLIILGEPGAGKTSLARKIQNPGYVLQEREKSTEGIDVLRYQFPTSIRTRDEPKEQMLQRDFRVNIWDFGGQEIYHATHQFFLTRRSVYVLVCDDRKEDTDFSYWLHAVDMLSDASPLLIVQNEKQDRKRDINLGALRVRYANLRDTLATNLDTNRGLERVIAAIRRELEGLPHVGVGLPATWKRVREELERDHRDYISLEAFFAICQQHGFTRTEDKLQLSGYLHDLGICLHFQDDAVLRNTVVLKPSWGTDAVYHVLDDAEVIAARGQFTTDNLTRIWDEPKYAGMQHELLRLMMRFQLCYALEGDKVFIAPQLLSSDQPSYPWNAGEGLVVRYEYEFLPKGIVTRFIVAMHRLISGGKLVWKTGVVLERDGTRAEVVEEYSQRCIRVRINGPDPRGMLALVDDQLERQHAAFPRLKYERYLPCPCSECQLKADPYGFAVEQLQKMVRRGQAIQCHSSGEMVDAAALVRELLPGVARIDLRKVDPGSPPSPTMTSIMAAPSAPQVFVSYAWNDESCAIVDRLQQVLGEHGIRLIRDREEVRYKDSIRDFMRRIGKGKCVVVVISEKYLKSENCMFEMLEVAKAQSLRERIFPIVLPDANLYKATGRVGYVKHWESECKALSKALGEVDPAHLSAIHADLDTYAEIRRLFDTIAGSLRDMNALTLDQHQGSGFDDLIRRIKAQLAT